MARKDGQGGRRTNIKTLETKYRWSEISHWFKNVEILFE